MRLAWLAALAACNGQQGTITLTLTEAPGSTLLDGVARLELIVTDPHQVVQADRGDTGFDLALDIDAAGGSGSVIIDGFDASGALIATGASPPFPIAAIDAGLTIYMAAPRSLAAAPAAMPAALSELALASLSYGIVISGGRDATGAPSANLGIYNAFNHTLVAGLAMPGPRAGQSTGIDSAGLVLLFGGSDATNAPTGSLWRFDTTVAPNGMYTDLGDRPELARAGQLMLPTGPDQFVVSGTPVFEIAQLGAAVATRDNPPSLPAAGAALTTGDGVPTAIFADATQLVRFRADVADTIAAAVPADPRVAAMPPDAVVVAGSTATLLLVDAETGAITTAATIATPRTGAAIAATSRYILIAGGTDGTGAVVGTAELFDPQLALVATMPMVVPRTRASAIPLPTGQILIAGGVDATGAPTATIELFTPDPPSD